MSVLSSLLFSLALLLISATSSALDSDREQNMVILSDHAEMGEKLSVLSGNVLIEQGSLKIEAAKAEIYRDGDGQIERAHLTGNPVKWQQQLEDRDGLVEAHAMQVNYLKSEEKLVLEDQVWIHQDGAEMTGNKVEYDLKTGLIEGMGGARPRGDGSEAGDGRIRMVLPPAKPKSRESDG